MAEQHQTGEFEEADQGRPKVARRNHYLARCYLKGFSVPRKNKRVIQVFDRLQGRSFQTRTENVAIERSRRRNAGLIK